MIELKQITKLSTGYKLSGPYDCIPYTNSFKHAFMPVFQIPSAEEKKKTLEVHKYSNTSEIAFPVLFVSQRSFTFRRI